MVELLAPCGNFESLSAAIKAGCDAVYFGVGHLNMRSLNTRNFKVDELKVISKICHENNVKAYLAMNTVMFQQDLKMIDDILVSVKKAKIDAVICFDFSVLQKARKLGIETHISTQMSIANYEALKFFSKYADRVVLARECTLPQIIEIKKKIVEENLKGPSGRLMEIECFAHGAMCISMSGRCFMSLFEFNSSANRGACLQPCRREYRIIDDEEGKELKVENNFVMSPEDLCTLPFLDKLVDAGIDVFKIEGRGKGADYVYTVVKAYKDALNSINKGVYNEIISKKLVDNVKCVFNRGMSEGFYMGVPLGKWSGLYGSKAKEQKVNLGVVKNYYQKINVAEIYLESGTVCLGEDVCFIGPTTGFYRLKVESMKNESGFIDKANKGDLITIKVSEKVRESDRIFVIQKRKSL